MIDWIQRIFDGICTIGGIRNRTEIKRTLRANQGIFGYEDDCDQTETYLGVIEELG